MEVMITSRVKSQRKSLPMESTEGEFENPAHGKWMLNYFALCQSGISLLSFLAKVFHGTILIVFDAIAPFESCQKQMIRLINCYSFWFLSFIFKQEFSYTFLFFVLNA